MLNTFGPGVPGVPGRPVNPGRPWSKEKSGLSNTLPKLDASCNN